jgi:predicted phosphodiesterase
MFIRIAILFSFLCAAGCAPEFTPWQTNVPKGAKNINAKNIAQLESLNLQLPMTVGIVGDPQGTPADFAQTVSALNRSRADFVILVGDLTNFSLKDEFVDTYAAMERSDKPILTAIGNHDAIAFGKSIYRDMFGAFDYSVRVAGIKFLLWNNCKFEFSDNNLDWLERELEEDAIVASHIEPIVDAHSPEDVERWLGLYQSKNALASFHGHRGGNNSFLGVKANLPVFVVAKVDGVRYGLVDIAADKTMRFYNCQADQCVELVL